MPKRRCKACTAVPSSGVHAPTEVCLRRHNATHAHAGAELLRAIHAGGAAAARRVQLRAQDLPEPAVQVRSGTLSQTAWQAIHLQFECGCPASAVCPVKDDQRKQGVIGKRESVHYLFYAQVAQCWCASRGSGSAIVLCVGGAREALLAEPGTFEIVLGKRLVRASVVRILSSFKHASLLQAHVSQALAAGRPGC